jgi:hypothetical protein
MRRAPQWEATGSRKVLGLFRNLGHLLQYECRDAHMMEIVPKENGKKMEIDSTRWGR